MSACWSTSDFYINAKHFIQLVILTPGLSRPSLAAHVRESGLALVNHPHKIGPPPKQPRQFKSNGLLPFTTCGPLSVPSRQMEDGSMVTVLSSLVLLFIFSSSTRKLVTSLAPRNSLVAGSFARPPFPGALSQYRVSTPIRYGWYCGR